ncbi:class I tRNA ligase family protein, partial [Candidatus Bathyarchaeota archaeon]|nr:class I tRNA ligase family protein [Candidatus Bathyarchaeota archaeon]
HLKTLSWLLKEGLKDKDITRDYDWGPPAPFPKAKGQVIYNWAENLLGYISATKHWAVEHNKPEMWVEYWKKSDVELYCFIGKDNLFFHTILFPALLIAYGDYVLPENVVVSEFVNLEGEKLSTSRGWVIWLHEMLEKFHPDMIRYYAVVIAPEHRDTDFKWKDFQAKVNNELIANLANFVNRVLTLLHKLSNGIVPEPDELNEYDKKILSEINRTAEKVMMEIERFEFKKGLKEIMKLSSLGNSYLNVKTPWNDADAASSTLYVASQIVYAISILLIPYLPFTATEIRRMLNILEDLNSVRWNSLKEILKPGHRVSKPRPLFRKIRDEDIVSEINKLEKLRIKHEIKTGSSRSH